MKETYGVAIIGCGHMGEAHMTDIYSKPHTRMICACDLDEARALDFQRKFGFARTTTDAVTCINDPAVDIVIIATYPSTHLSYLRLCLQAGKHVLCEKPMASSETEGQEFLRLVKAHKEVKVLVGYILRHNRTYQKAAEMIQNGAIGFPIIFRMVQNHHTIDWPKYRRLIEETSPIIDCGVHYLDVMQWFTGAHITHLSGIGQRTEEDLPKDAYNYGMITAQMSDGSIGYYEAGWTNSISADNRKEFVGPRGSIRLIFRKDRDDHKEEGDLLEYYRYPEKDYQIINVDCERKPTGDQFDYLIRMIEENVPAVPSIDEVFDSFRLAVAADRAIRTHAPEMVSLHECVPAV